MKKSIYILACAGLMAVSCGEESPGDPFLVVTSDSETMFSNETYAEAAVMNIYRQFGVDKVLPQPLAGLLRRQYGFGVVRFGVVRQTPTDTKTLIYTYNPTYDDAGDQLNEAAASSR
ncbi:MAG: hypothetical protein ACLVK4_14615 [Alistipes shahii]|uniref:hypothetical protein n=1 Tax=Alistipes shahii TaxID=328814 RepID=UPI00399D4707